MFEWFFKFNPINYSEGELGLEAGGAMYVFAVLVIVVVVVFALVYTATRLYTSNKSKALSLGLRIAALSLLAFPLFEPVLIMPDVVPDENFVAVLVDASKSMNIPDATNREARIVEAANLLFGEDQGVVPDLEEHFQLRYYTFGEAVTRVDSVQAGQAGGVGTNISAALDRVISDFKGVPLSGVVVLSDGSDNSTEVPLNKAQELRNLDIPLHIVGLGEEEFAQERELLEVNVSEGIEETTGAEIDVKVRDWSAESESVVFRLFRGEQELMSESRRLKGEGKIDQLTFFYEPAVKGAHEYILKIDEAPAELNTENNTADLLIDTRKDTIRVLYFEGQLRSEFKFIKRVLEDDHVVEIASISRTGTGKFYRQGIKDPGALEGGFANSIEELYNYKAIIFGDIEASSFTPEQLRMIERFVGERGGGFLMLGGRNSFVEGDYWNTPIADVLPLELDLSRRTVIPPRFADPGKRPVEQGFSFVPTPAGLESPIMKLSADAGVNQTLWNEMPGLTTINFLGAVKPAGIVLAEKPEDDFGSSEPILAVQRYGKGRSAALATSSTWRWQMLLDVEDNRHERFWRQLVRWLVGSAPNRVNLNHGQNRFAPEEDVETTVTVYDSTYAPLNGVEVQGRITTPSGEEHPVTFQQELAEVGTYKAHYVPNEEGLYEHTIDAWINGRYIGTQTKSFLVRPSKKEFNNATLKRPFLENLARASNGVYYTPTEAAALPENLRSRRTSTSIYRSEPVWDTPLWFGLILLLLSAEWIYRRRKGLP